MNNIHKYKYPIYDNQREIIDLKEMLYSSAKIYSDNNAFLIKKDGEYKPVSYVDFCKDVDALGTALISEGLSGKKIGIIGENRYEWAVSYLAVVCGVGIVVPMDKELPAQEISSLANTAQLDAVIYSPKLQSVVNDTDIPVKINMETQLPLLLELGRKIMQDGDTSYKNIKIDSEAVSVLLFTSGTTSDAKAVMLSHKNIVSNLIAMSSMIYVDDKDVFLSVLPLHHTYECTCGFLCALHIGACIAYCEGLRHIAKNLQETHATIMLGVPLLFENMYNRIWKQAEKNKMTDKLRKAVALSTFLRKFRIDIRKKLFADIHNSMGGKLRLMICGAAPVEPNVLNGYRDFGFNVLQGYGLTECSPIAAVNRDNEFRDKSAGLIMPNVEMKTVNQSPDGIGELVIRGDNVMLGYYNNPEATAEAIRDGWFYSGDLGYIDGYFVYITGRKKNVIVTKNGKNIFPEELENHLNKSEYIAESMVYGEDTDDGDISVTAMIFPEIEAVKEKLGDDCSDENVYNLLYDEINTVNHKLQNYKRISKLIVRKEEFEKTTTKKIKRYKVNK